MDRRRTGRQQDESGILRAELLSIEQLKRAAVSLAREHQVESGGGSNRLLVRLDDNARSLRESYETILAADGAGRRMAPAEEWILDNFYLIEQQIGLARIHLPRGYSQRLPRLAMGSQQGLPRVYGIAAFLIAHLDGLLDMESVAAFVRAYQSVETLKLGELWAIPIMLRLALIENLRRTAGLLAQRRRDLDRGLAWAQRIEEIIATNPRQILAVLAQFAEENRTLSAPFLAELTGRLRSQGSSVTLVLNWIDQALAEESTTVAQRLHQDGRQQAAEQLTVTNSIGSLRSLDAADWKEFVEEQSRVEQILRRDPLGAYALQDFATRDHYRHIVERLAERSGRSESEVATMALERALAGEAKPDCQRARHVGSYLVGGHRFMFRKEVGCPWTLRYAISLLLRRYRLFFYLSGVVAATLLIAVWPFWGCGMVFYDWRAWLLIAAALLPASSLSLSLINFIVTARVDPHPLPRLDFSNGIPADHRTMVAVPVLITGVRSLETLVERLEIHYLANRDPNLQFALLTDFADAASAEMPGDAALLSCARQAIERLNARYARADAPAPFHIFHRPRIWNPHESVWMGYERKRGKLEQFNAYLRGGAREAFSLVVGDMEVLTSIRYVITLDADTDLPRGAAQSLVGALAHPLNRPRFDATCGRVVEGYAVLQPRVSIRLTSANRSIFAKMTCGETGFDPYSREVSDVYQDLFSEGSFVGKGIYDVDAFSLALQARFPDNLILSHDLIESCYARSGLLGYVEVYEDAPASYLGEMCRQHRWMRGDWQIIQWLGRRPPRHGKSYPRQPVSHLAQWKILDNLRRSLVAPSMLLLLLVGWIAGPVPPIRWTLFALLVLGLSGVVRSATLLLRKPRERTFRIHLRAWLRRFGRHVGQPLFSLGVMPYEAFVALGAIAQSALRLPFTRRSLLHWHMPHYRRLGAIRSAGGFLGEMWFAPLTAASAIALTLWRQPATLPAVAPVALLWLLAPLTAWCVSRPIVRRGPSLSDAHRNLLRKLACRTWYFFETFVSAKENWLPPDNFQEVPQPMIATRTSPTNLSFGLTTCLAAWDFGYISTERMLERLERMLDAMERLDRYRGHFFNWYDTRTLKPLPPRYVSSVDSGNLAAGLVTLRSGLLEVCDTPAYGAQLWNGIRDTLMVVAEEAAGATSPDFIALLRETELVLVVAPSDPSEAGDYLASLEKLTLRLAERATAEGIDGASLWCRFLFQLCRDHLERSSRFATPQGVRLTLRQLARDGAEEGATPEAVQLASDLVKRAEALAERCSEMRRAMEFGFLYNHDRELLHIGFDADARRLDPSCYDLLASEARIASFLMIAANEAPPEHWFALGRLLAGRGGTAALVSWSGSIFEYLMPSLFMRCYPGTLLDRSNHAVVERQIRYGRQRQIPWGISESCYHATDAQHVYQYRAFGVPGLGLKRGLSDDLVVAPYAAMLALPFAATAACANIERLIKHEEALGTYGLYEAIDYTPSRLPRGRQRAVIRTFMAHHQGMGMLALSHLLLDAPMVRRFMSDFEVRSTEMLLQERVPDVTPVVHPHQREAASKSVREDGKPEETVRLIRSPDTAVPAVQLLSNGNYHVMVTNAGGSSSRWQRLALTRWREDFTCDNWGTYLYLRDVMSNQTWSNTYHPLRRPADIEEAIFSQGRAEYRRLLHDIECHTEICVSPEDDVEIRRVTLNNRGRHPRYLELTSYAEVVLAPTAADLAHRTFSNLFIATETMPQKGLVLCTRRRRSPDEAEAWYFQLLYLATGAAEASCETDRARFLGRGRTTANPAALDGVAGTPQPLSNSSGFVLDPIAAVRVPAKLTLDSPLQAVLVSGAAATRQEALALAEKYHDRHFVERAFDMAWSHSQIVMRQLNVSDSDTHVYEHLAASVLYANRRNRAPWTTVARNRLGQQGLWRFGISGDLPIVLLRIGDIRRMDLVEEVLKAHAYWRMKGLASDLVILNEDFSGYRATLNERILAAISSSPEADHLDRPGGVFLRRIENLSEEDQVLFQSVARVVLADGPENLREQVERRYIPHRMPAPHRPTMTSMPATIKQLDPPPRLLENGLGGFSPDGYEYVICLNPGSATPAPWSNVIAGNRLGMVVSESGGIYTWVDNAHEYRLTTWHNDPTSDASGEAFYLRDEESGEFWSLASSPAPGYSGYLCRHGFGYTLFEHEEREIRSEMRIFAAIDEPVRCVAIKLTNLSQHVRHISLTAFHELVLGEWRHDNLMHIQTEIDAQTGQLFVRNPYCRVYPSRVVFATCSEADIAISGDRTEFLGRNGTLQRPKALFRERLSGRAGTRYDPAATLQAFCHLAPGETREVVFTLGAAEDENEARRLYRLCGKPAGAQNILEAVGEHWRRLLGTIQVDVPDATEFNLLVNGWLLYQTLSCRLWGRSGYYQSSGAYGFRDQLQDAMALLHAAPQLLRQQILTHAARQFPEGDVQHWWHPPTGAGVRTRIVDDRLWLPQAVARYVLATGDQAILDEQIPFLHGRQLDPDEESRYELHTHDSATATLYEHCLRAIRATMQYGAHGLPLMGGGDWNDGLNSVGLKGRGESVWMAWFLCDTLRRFEELALLRHDRDIAELCRHERQALAARTEESAWDGAWYRRAYFDDGTPLGSAANAEGSIDAISQSWAVLSGCGRADRARQALAALQSQLVRRDDGIILLLTPPFDRADPNPGYIRSYPPGIRENGAQYTHAAIWTVMAFAMIGDHDTAWQLLDMINPINHSRTPADAARYCVEPYVMAADVYSMPPHTGRGGWSWYTGGAGWMYRLAIETLLGLERHPDHLRVTPRLPSQGPRRFRLVYRHGEATYSIAVAPAAAGEKPGVRLDGQPLPDGRIPLSPAPVTHQVEVTI